jgi:peptidoglycan/LPS O-acetylase OafA/YrhL
MNRQPRLQVLDTVRGLAAAAVVLHHLLLAFWPYLADPAFPAPHGRVTVARLIAASPLSAAHDGSFAVVVFFVLSGFVLAHSYFRSPDHGALTAAALRRYFRLAVPTLASVLLSYALLRSGGYRNQQAAAAGASAWLGAWYRFTPHLFVGPYAAVPRALLGTFFNGSGTPYNNVLWTMSVEMPGSLLVFASLALFGRARNRWIVYAVGGWVLGAQGSLLFDFLLGTALCDAYVHGPDIDLRWSAGPLLAVAACLACRRPALGDDRLPGIVLTQTVAAALVVAVPLLSSPLRRWAAARPLAWLGRISFGLYLVHMLVIASLGSGVYAALRRSAGWSHDAAAAAASAAAIAVSLLGGWGLYLAADRPSVRLGKWVVDVLFEPRIPEVAPPVAFPVTWGRTKAA